MGQLLRPGLPNMGSCVVGNSYPRNEVYEKREYDSADNTDAHPDTN